MLADKKYQRAEAAFRMHAQPFTLLKKHSEVWFKYAHLAVIPRMNVIKYLTETQIITATFTEHLTSKRLLEKNYVQSTCQGDKSSTFQANPFQ